MKSIHTLVLVIATVAADVSHLTNTYLPPKSVLNFAASVQQVDKYTTSQFNEPSNNLAYEEAIQESVPQVQAQPEISQHQDYALDQRFDQQQEVAVPEVSQYVESHFEKQPSAQTYRKVSKDGIQQHAEEAAQYYQSAASSSGVDTQYGSNGGYVY